MSTARKSSVRPAMNNKIYFTIAQLAFVSLSALGSAPASADARDDMASVVSSRSGGLAAKTFTAPTPAPLAIKAGDKLRLAFYERLDTDEDKWRSGPGKAQPVPRGFLQRAELTGEYAVQDSGVLSLPLLGEFIAVGRSSDALRQDINAAFEQLIERRGFVNVLSIERQPIQIIGTVKNPGSFPFKQGMTVLHAVALAGGVPRKEMEPWQRVEAGREFERLQRALDKVKRLVARNSVLKSERDGEAGVRPDLVNVLGQRDAHLLVTDEDWQRSLATASRTTKETTLSTVAQNARRDLAVRTEKAEVVDNGFKLRKERAESMNQLFERRLIAKPLLAQVQSEFSDASDRRLQSVIEIETARQRLAAAERDIKNHKLESSIEVNRAMSVNTRETMDAVADGEGIIEVMRTLTSGQGSDANAQSFEIVRMTAKGPVVLQAKDIDGLEPGDLVRVK